MPARRSNTRSKSRASGDWLSNVRLSGAAAVLFVIGMVAVLYFGARWKDGAAPTLVPPGVPGGGVTFTPPGAASPPIQVWFSDPLSSAAGPDGPLVQAIDGAQQSIDMAIYNFSLDNVARALINAKARGVTVRLVMESESIGDRVPRMLDGAGIPIVGDNREGLMHNKFTIIDEQEVFTGSMNYTASSAYNDFNNLVRIRSQRVAKDYMVEFDEMFIENLFGPDTRALTPYPEVTINNTLVEVYFSPDDKVAKQVLAELESAQKSIDFMAYSFTRDDFAQAMRERAAAGVQVRGVFDESQVISNTGGEYDALSKDGFDVRLDGISGLLHSKVIIVDGETVITGSYNFSNNAERTNDENVVIIHDARIAQEYLKNFETVYQNAKK